ncbi:MAG: PIN domain-containing protein [Puniceicoccaceae bacterium]
MIADCFLDSNILINFVDTDPSVSRKRKRSEELIESQDFGISAQVLQEFYTVSTAKLKHPLDSYRAFQLVDKLMEFPVIAIDEGIVTEGIRNSMKYQISYWDGAIIAAAERLKCKVLYTEDLNDGQQYGSVTVKNPFVSD